MSGRIPLTRGLEAIVDESDLRLVAGHKWYAQVGGGGLTYAAHRRPSREGAALVYMHRLILQAPAGVKVDHINGNGLDNRSANLRLATNSQNTAHTHRSPRNVNGFRGVFFGSPSRKKQWYAQIVCGGRKRTLGYFDDPRKAAIAYDEAAVRLFGEFATTNKKLDLL